MKTFIIITFLYFNSVLVFSQPGPLPDYIIKDSINLNDISDKQILECLGSRFCSKGVIVIDSTTNLNNLYKLANFEDLVLLVKVEKIPTDGINWKTKYLSLNGGNKLSNIDLSSFRKLEQIYIENYSGKKLSKNPLVATNLSKMYLWKCPNLESLDNISNLKNLIELNISEIPLLKSFPKLIKHNSIKKLSLDKTTNSIENLKYLKNLKELYLRNNINSIPYTLPESLEKLTLGSSSREELKDLNALNNLPNLKVFRFGNYYVTDTTSTFPNIELERLEFNLSGNVNFIFKFKKINNLVSYGIGPGTHFGVNSLNSYNSTTIFENIYISGLKDTPDLNPLLESIITNSLTIKYSEIKTLPNIEILKSIPNVLIENNKHLKIEDMILSENWKITNNDTNEN